MGSSSPKVALETTCTSQKAPHPPPGLEETGDGHSGDAPRKATQVGTMGYGNRGGALNHPPCRSRFLPMNSSHINASNTLPPPKHLYPSERPSVAMDAHPVYRWADPNK